MARFTWLSYPLGLNDPRPPAIPAPELSPLYTIARDGANVQILRAANHTGTHVDAPRHVIEDGVRITEFSPEEFLFTNPVVIDLPLSDCVIVTPEHLEPLAGRIGDADLALFRFGYGGVRKTDPDRFSARCPGFGIAGARWLRVHFPRLRALGMDVPSLACIASLDETMASHHELLGGPGRRFLVLEDMDLDQDLTGLCEVRMSPWMVEGFDSGPCSVVGVFD
jgi:arylformamidase